MPIQTPAFHAVRLGDEHIDRLIREDVSYLDLTIRTPGIGPVPVKITFFSREQAITTPSLYFGQPADFRVTIAPV